MVSLRMMGWGLAVAGKFFRRRRRRRRRRRHLGVDPQKLGFCIKNIEYHVLREWTLEQSSRRATTWKLITTALRVFLVFTTWGDRQQISFLSKKHKMSSLCQGTFSEKYSQKI